MRTSAIWDILNSEILSVGKTRNEKNISILHEIFCGNLFIVDSKNWNNEKASIKQRNRSQIHNEMKTLQCLSYFTCEIWDMQYISLLALRQSKRRYFLSRSTISTSYCMGTSAIWDILFEFRIFFVIFVI